MTVDIFEYTHYKIFVIDKVKSFPKGGHGVYRKIAAHLQINSVMVSQIFKGDRNLNPDQAFLMAEFFGLNELASNFFITLVRLERAANYRYKTKLKEELADLKEQSTHLKNRVKKDTELDEKSKSEFYSRWYYSGIRLASSLENCQSAADIASRLNMPLGKVQKVVDFLVENGLCVLEEDNIKMGPQRTHLGSNSPFLGRHHMNWRLKALTQMDSLGPDELFYTGPMSLSEKLVKEIRNDLMNIIAASTDKVVESEPETLACLSVGWFKF